MVEVSSPGRIKELSGSVEFVGMRVEVRVWGRSFESRRERGVVESGGESGSDGASDGGSDGESEEEAQIPSLKMSKGRVNSPLDSDVEGYPSTSFSTTLSPLQGSL